MSLIKIDSSKGLYEVLGNGLLANPVVIPEITQPGSLDTTLGFHLHVSTNADHVITLDPADDAGQLLLITNIGGSDLTLDAGALTVGAPLDGAWTLPAKASVLLVSTGTLWSMTSQSL